MFKEKTKNTNFRAWKSGKTWLYGASVFLLAGAPMLPAAVPVVGAIQAFAGTVTENGASLTVPDSAVSLFVGESLTASQFGVSASGSGVGSASLAVTGLHPDSAGSQSGAVSISYAYTTDSIVPGAVNRLKNTYSYGSFPEMTGPIGSALPAVTQQNNVKATASNPSAAVTGQFFDAVMVFPNKELASSYQAKDQSLFASAFPNWSGTGAISAGAVNSYFTALQNYVASVGGTFVSKTDLTNLTGKGSLSHDYTVNYPAMVQPEGSLYYYHMSALHAVEKLPDTTVKVPHTGTLASSFPVNYYARPELKIPADVTMFASDVLAKEDTGATVTDSLAAVDNGKLSSSLVSSSASSLASSSSTDSSRASDSSDSSSASDSKATDSTSESVRLPAGSSAAAAKAENSELKYHEGKSHTSTGQDQLTSPGIYVIGYDYDYIDPVLGTKHKLHKEQTVTVYPDPIATAPEDLKLTQGDQLDKEEAKVEDTAKEFDKGTLTADYSKVDTSIPGTYSVTFTYTYHDPYTETDKTVTAVQHVEIVNTPVIVKDIRASVRYTDGSNDLTPKAPVSVPEGKVGDDWKIAAAPAIDGYEFVKVTFNDREVKAGDTVTLAEENQLVYVYKAVTKKVTISVLPQTGENPTPWILSYSGFAVVLAALGIWKRRAIAKLFGKLLKRGR